MKHRLGIYSGSFNPIHKGHILLCKYLIDNNYVDDILISCSPLNPLKETNKNILASTEDRNNMVKMVVDKYEHINDCHIEEHLPKPNYTITTLNEINKLYPEYEIYLIIGSDNWLIFDKWKSYEEILNNYHVIVYPRNGYKNNEYNTLNINNVIFIGDDAPQFNISSTEIRQSINNKTDMIDNDVLKYIQYHSLYK